MTILKLKAMIYRYTEIYLADKEQLEYITSKEFWKQYRKFIEHPENDMSLRDIQGLLIGLWESRHGFHRPFVTWSFNRPWYIKVVAYLYANYLAIKFDLRKFYGRI